MSVFFLKIWLKLIELFKQGLSPRDLMLSIVVSLLISVVPILGIDVFLLTAIALPFRLNLPIMITVSYLTTPLKFALLIPFIQFGGSILGVDHKLLSLEAIKASFDVGFFNTITALSYEIICGLVGWAIFAIPIMIVAFSLLKLIMNFLPKKYTLTN